jgi:hypothetical protein
VALCGLAAIAPPSGGASPEDAPPASFKRYLPRGRIPGLLEPRFVPAAEARIPDDAWVLGVVLNGQARAYDLNLLTRHEVVNDRFGDQPVATVWCPLANTAVVYDRRVGGRELRFEPSGVLLGGSIVMQDKETDSYWPILQGEAQWGELRGTKLEMLPVTEKMRFKDWRTRHPDTVVLSSGGMEHFPRNPLAPYQASTYGFRGTVAEDTRLPTKEQVFGFERGGRRYAIASRALAGGRVVAVDDVFVFLHRPADADLYEDTRAFLSPTGFERLGERWVEKGSGAAFDPARGAFLGGRGTGPVRLHGFDTYWYVWSLNYPGTGLLTP